MLSRAMQRIYVASTWQNLATMLKNREPSLEVIKMDLNSEETLNDTDLKTVGDNAEILVADLPVIHQIINIPTKMKWAHSTWAGTDYLTKRMQGSKNQPTFLLSKTHCGFGEQMAEYVLSYILAFTRKLFRTADCQKDKDWNRCKSIHLNYRALSSLSIGILGLGNSGKHVAKACKLFGMEVWVLLRTEASIEDRASYFDQHRVFSPDSLVEVLANCDFICSILPSTEQTRGLLAGDMFSHCKAKKPVFINIGRGDVTDEPSIVRALEKGWLSGAVLDVFTEEPLPKDNRLWSMPNVHITPHSAALSFETCVAQSFLENYAKYNQREPLVSPVDLQAGY